MREEEKENESGETKEHETIEEVENVYRKLYDCYTVQQQPADLLNGVSPRDYWNASRAIFNVINVVNKEEQNDWRSRYFAPKARNRVIGRIAQDIAENIGPIVTAQNFKQKDDKLVARAIQDIMLWSFDREKWDEKKFWFEATASIEGTAVLEENYTIQKRKVKKVEDMDFETGEIKYNEVEVKEWEGAYFSIVPNDQFLVPNIYERDLDKQDYVIRVVRTTHAAAEREFAKYPNWSKVIPGNSDRWYPDSDHFKRFEDYISLNKEEVLIMKYFNLSEDKMLIIANGVLLNDINTPIPRPHNKKKYPFVMMMKEPIDNDFIYGASVAHRLAKEDALYNNLIRMFVDREHLKNFAPLVTSDPALQYREIYRPGAVTVVEDPGGVQAIQGLFSNMDGGLVNLIQMIERNADENSISPLEMGQESGGSMTATETMALRQGSQTRRSVAIDLTRHAMSRIGELRTHTLLWRLNDIEDLDQITVWGRTLKSGKEGARTTLLQPGVGDMSEKERMKLSKELDKMENESGGEMEMVALDPTKLENLDLLLRFDAQPQEKRTDDMMKLLAMDKFQIYSQHPDVFDKKASAEEVAIALGDDPEKILVKQAPFEVSPQMAPPGQGQAPAPGGQPGQPELALAGGSPGSGPGRQVGLRDALGMPPT